MVILSSILFLALILIGIYVLGVIFVFVATIPSERMGCKISIWDKLSPKKWYSFVNGTFKSIILPEHHLEQLIVFRYYNQNCKQCLEKGCCINCGCTTYSKMLDGNAVCASGYWNQYMSRSKWEDWKKNFKITIKIEKI